MAALTGIGRADVPETSELTSTVTVLFESPGKTSFPLLVFHLKLDF